MDNKLDRAAELLKLLGHPMRIKIVLLLKEHSSLNVTELTRHVKQGQSLVSHSLISMTNREILQINRRGRERYYSLADPTYAEIIELLMNSQSMPLHSESSH